MANMLATHPEVYIPLRETGIFRTHVESEAKEGFAGLLEDAEASGKRFLAEKTPRHVRHMRIIRTVVPGARFVIPVRDGRDVAASYTRRTGEPPLGIDQWITSNSIVASEQGAEDVFVYRHEDLIEDPEGTVRRVCEFTTIPFDEAILRYHEQENLWFGQTGVFEAEEGRYNASYRNWQVNQPIFDNRGQWTSVLHEGDFPQLQEGVGLELMKTFGYVD